MLYPPGIWEAAAVVREPKALTDFTLIEAGSNPAEQHNRKDRVADGVSVGIAM